MKKIMIIIFIFIAGVFTIFMVKSSIAVKIWEPGMYSGKEVSSMTIEELEENIKDAAKSYLFWKRSAQKRGENTSHRAELYKRALEDMMSTVKLRKQSAKKHFKNPKNFKDKYRAREEYMRLIKVEDTYYRSLNPQKSGIMMTIDDINDALQEGGISNLDPVEFLKSISKKAAEKYFINHLINRGLPEELAREQWELLSGMGKTEIKTPVEHLSDAAKEKLKDMVKESIEDTITDASKVFSKNPAVLKKILKNINVVNTLKDTFLAVERIYLYTQTNHEDLIGQVKKLREKGLDDKEIVKWYKDSEFRKEFQERLKQQEMEKQALLKEQAGRRVIEQYKRYQKVVKAKHLLAEYYGRPEDEIGNDDINHFIDDSGFRASVMKRISSARDARNWIALAKGIGAQKVSREEVKRFLEDSKYKKWVIRQAKIMAKRYERLRQEKRKESISKKHKYRTDTNRRSSEGEPDLDRVVDIVNKAAESVPPSHVSGQLPESLKNTQKAIEESGKSGPPGGMEELQKDKNFQRFLKGSNWTNKLRRSQ